jgi:hypothetical protein
MTSIILVVLGVINVEKDEKLFLQVLYRQITRFSDRIPNLEIWESVWVTNRFWQKSTPVVYGYLNWLSRLIDGHGLVPLGICIYIEF